VPTFNSVAAGLAFDICKNVRGQGTTTTFWAYWGAMGKKMGFTWGGDWKSFVDKRIFNGTETEIHVEHDSVGQIPPQMTLYQEKEEKSVTVEERKKIVKAKAGLSDATVDFCTIPLRDPSGQAGRGDERSERPPKLVVWPAGQRRGVVWCSYLLAWCGRAEIAEAFQGGHYEIIGVVLIYC
jgi:hypothetical protein